MACFYMDSRHLPPILNIVFVSKARDVISPLQRHARHGARVERFDMLHDRAMTNTAFTPVKHLGLPAERVCMCLWKTPMARRTPPSRLGNTTGSFFLH